MIRCSSLPSWASREDISSKGKKSEGQDRSKRLDSNALEDRPIAGSRKNFDELLAEQLGKDSVQVKLSDASLGWNLLCCYDINLYFFHLFGATSNEG